VALVNVVTQTTIPPGQTPRDHFIHDLPSLLLIFAIIGAIYGLYRLFLRWYDRRIGPERAEELARSDRMLRDYRIMRRGAFIRGRAPNLDTTWERGWRDDEQWRNSAPEKGE
jgi:hypothetical protein